MADDRKRPCEEDVSTAVATLPTASGMGAPVSLAAQAALLSDVGRIIDSFAAQPVVGYILMHRSGIAAGVMFPLPGEGEVRMARVELSWKTWVRLLPYTDLYPQARGWLHPEYTEDPFDSYSVISPCLHWTIVRCLLPGAPGASAARYIPIGA